MSMSTMPQKSTKSTRHQRCRNENVEVCKAGACGADDRHHWTPWNSWGPLPSTSANNAYMYDDQDNSSASGSEEAEEAVTSEDSCEGEEESEKDSLEELKDHTCADVVDWNSTVTSAIDSLCRAQAAVAKLTGCHSDHCPGCGGPRSLGLSGNTDWNQSASCRCRAAARANADKVAGEVDGLAAQTSSLEAVMELEESAGDGDVWKDAPTAGEEASCAGWRKQQKRKLTTCEIDVIGQRLNSCLKLLQGGPFQECDKCVQMLSSCDPNQLSSRELMERLNNLETLLLYLQVHFRSGMSCKTLKLMCQLKKAVGCMHGFLLKRQSEDALAEVGQLHQRLDNTANFRRHWRLIPPGGEKFRFVADSLDCVPRVEAEDEWLRQYLPDAEKASLGHILADSDPTVPDWLGKQMSFSKLRGRSTRLNNLFTRDAYEDMLRHYMFALK